MKNRNLVKVGFLSTLLCASVAISGCHKGDDPSPDNGGQQNTVDGVLLSELRCTVAEFADKYIQLKQGVPVTVTLTDVTDANIAKVSETLRKMHVTAPLSKAGADTQYIITLIMESVSEALKEIPTDAFKGVDVIRELVIPACVETVKSGAFAECLNLELVKILGSNTKVDAKAFDGDREDIRIEIADGNVSLKFDGNGFKGGIAPGMVIYKESTILPDQGSMERPGFKFLGWAKSADAKKAEYEAGSSFNGKADVLYAVWKSYQFAITYHFDPQNPDRTDVQVLTGKYIESEHPVFGPVNNYYEPDYNKQYFKCWKDSEGNEYNQREPVSIYQDLDLYPVYVDIEAISIETLEIDFFK